MTYTIIDHNRGFVKNKDMVARLIIGTDKEKYIMCGEYTDLNCGIIKGLKRVEREQKGWDPQACINPETGEYIKDDDEAIQLLSNFLKKYGIKTGKGARDNIGWELVKDEINTTNPIAWKLEFAPKKRNISFGEKLYFKINIRWQEIKNSGEKKLYTQFFSCHPQDRPNTKQYSNIYNYH